MGGVMSDLETVSVPRICLFCRYFYLSPNYPGYSELTPGSDMAVYCIASTGHWDLANANDTNDARKMMLMAQTCPDYELSHEAFDIIAGVAEE